MSDSCRAHQQSLLPSTMTTLIVTVSGSKAGWAPLGERRAGPEGGGQEAGEPGQGLLSLAAHRIPGKGLKLQMLGPSPTL